MFQLEMKWPEFLKLENKNLLTIEEDYYLQKELNIELMVFGILKMKVNSQAAKNISSLGVH